MNKYVILSILSLLALSSFAPAALAAGGVITNPKKVLFVGPQLDAVTYSLPADTTVSLSPNHAIIGNELGLDVATWTTIGSDAALTTGKDPGFNDQGVYFNMLRPVTNNTHFRRAFLYLQDFGYYQTTMLSGSGGTATPSILACSLYAASCKNGPHHTPAENLYGGQNFQKAINELLATQSDPNPNSRLFEGNSSDIACAKTASDYCKGLTWHIGSPGGPAFTPNWIGRGSLLRGAIGAYVLSQANLIGLDLTTNYLQIGGHSTSAKYVEQQSVKSVISDGVYNPKTGFNSAPVYNFSRASPASCPSGPTTHADCWDMYSYGFGFTANSLLADTEFFNSAFGSSETNPGLYYNRSMDFATNGVIYAKSISSAQVNSGKVSLYEMQNLPWINVYFQNTLWGVLTNTWTGYADIPTQGPNSLTGLYYTLLNLHATCFPASCLSGGNAPYGLASTIDAPGGLTPLANFNSVYDADITNQIYDSPTITGPSQFNTPGKYTSWMLSYNGKFATLQSAALAVKIKNFNGMTGSLPGVWTDFQQGTSTTLSNAPQKIVHGQELVLTFAPNIYFSDHIQVTAADYNESLYVSNLALSPTLPDSATPVTGAMAGPSGLIATNIDPANPLTINIFVNSTTIWNALNVIVPVLPLHIFRYLNIDNSYNIANTIDTSFNWNALTQSANGCVSCNATNVGPAPAWLKALPNLEVGEGPFILRSWDGVNQAGQILRNVNYYRSFWQMNTTNNLVNKGSSFTFKAAVYEWSFDPVNCASSPDSVCKIPMTSLNSGLTSGTLDLLNSAGKVVASFPLSCSGGVCSGSISTSGPGWHTGDNELQFTASYNYLGLPRTWYQLTGVHLH